MKLIIDIDEEDYNFLMDNHIEYNLKSISKQSEKDIQGTLAILRTIDNVKNSKSLQAELEEIKAEMQDYGCSFIIAKRIDLASAVSNCIRMVDKHIKEIEEK